MRRIEGAERDALILSIINRIESDTQRIGAPERAAVWERGWYDAAIKFKMLPTRESLVPAFIRSNQPVRYKQDYCWPDEGESELDHVRSVQKELAQHFNGCAHVAEFGCGTGFNLVALADQMAGVIFTGYDFASSAVQLANDAGWALQLPVNAFQFDMISPRPVAGLGGGGVLTFGAVEQLAGQFHSFIDFLLANGPKIVVHVEPTVELYDPTNLVDALAIAFHMKRGYTTGLLPYLQEHPGIQMLEVKRTFCGSLMHEGYNVIAWRPK